MTALSAPQRLDKYAPSDILAIQAADGETIHSGGLVALGSPSHGTADVQGRTKKWAAADFEIPIGFALPNPANATDGRWVGSTTAPRPETNIDTGVQTLRRYPVTGTSAQANVGLPVYATDDNVLTITRPAANAIPVGVITKWWTGTTCDVRIFGFNLTYLLALCGAGATVWNMGVMSAGAGTGNVLTGIVAPFHGRILAVYGVVAVDATDADVVQTINFEIGGVDVTGGVITWAFGDAIGVKVAGTAITAANEFHHGDLIDVETTATVAGTTADPGLLNLYATVELLPGV